MWGGLFELIFLLAKFSIVTTLTLFESKSEAPDASTGLDDGRSTSTVDAGKEGGKWTQVDVWQAGIKGPQATLQFGLLHIAREE